ncbi:hypothetical protein QE152_g19544 [Popillia japonica]|uniref:Ribosomal protein S3 n=1 Tax=Popillia japonica TaxID=7064 RepID=A0AAW1KRA9_POPJA
MYVFSIDVTTNQSKHFSWTGQNIKDLKLINVLKCAVTKILKIMTERDFETYVMDYYYYGHAKQRRIRLSK